MKVRILGAHNCESQDTRLISLLIDDSLVLDAGGLTSSLSFPAQQRLKAVLLTHAHYDHIRDIPTLGMNLLLSGATINIYSTLPVYDALLAHLLGSQLYPNFLERPAENPTLKFILLEPHQTEQIAGYRILVVPVNHSAPAVGYQITSSDSKVVFYTGDAGPCLADCWQQVSPQLLITEVTTSNRYEGFARESGHLAPDLLKHELVAFRELKGYLPRVIIVHMSPTLEKEIEAEIATVAEDLNHPITLGYEGMQLDL